MKRRRSCTPRQSWATMMYSDLSMCAGRGARGQLREYVGGYTTPRSPPYLLQVLMAVGISRFTLWNPCSLRQDDYRMDETSSVFRAATVVALPGTQVRGLKSDAHTRVRTEFHTVIQFLHSAAPYTNKSAGCALMVTRRIPQRAITRITVPPSELAGSELPDFLLPGAKPLTELPLDAPPIGIRTPTGASDEFNARADLWGTVKTLSKRCRRKYSPSWSLPTELFVMIASPKYFTKPGVSRAGLTHATLMVPLACEAPSCVPTCGVRFVCEHALVVGKQDYGFGGSRHVQSGAGGDDPVLLHARGRPTRRSVWD